MTLILPQPSQSQDWSEWAGKLVQALRSKFADDDRANNVFSTLFYVGTPGNPPFTGLWANFGSGAEGLYFTRIGGIVLVGGAVSWTGAGNPNSTTPGANETVFTLPQLYRPSAILAFGASSVAAVNQINIYPSGIVQWRNWIVGPPGKPLDMTLTGLVFPAEQ